MRRLSTAIIIKTITIGMMKIGQLYHTYRGHATEIVCLSFSPHGTSLATGSMDNTARIWVSSAGLVTIVMAINFGF